MAVKVVPTRGNLFKLVRKLRMARKGHGLLEQKRQILMLELSSTIAKARKVQKEVAEVFEDAYSALQRANISLGVETVEEIAHSIPEEQRFVIRLRSVMGVEIPEVDPLEPKTTPAYSFLETSSSMDEAYLAFCRVRSMLSQLAEVENAVYRLAVQVRRTNRRVNALEKVVIPATMASIAEISSVLEESEREDFVRMKTAKNQKTKKEG
ncbi:V-type ATP synthase subunit D [Thermovirga sp.]|uniref:V-type ATP synthase subunit D n=1 Tax=Thermovirga sp. TaxID=2699834 RepID=UPI0025F9B836|nr:V-type ATP synthase subunit D [Thermovirga sp.]MBO8154259.1 V-type ATP synthase subunit D [Thermovirga sp.]